MDTSMRPMILKLKVLEEEMKLFKPSHLSDAGRSSCDNDNFVFDDPILGRNNTSKEA